MASDNETSVEILANAAPQVGDAADAPVEVAVAATPQTDPVVSPAAPADVAAPKPVRGPRKAARVKAPAPAREVKPEAARAAKTSATRSARAATARPASSSAKSAAGRLASRKSESTAQPSRSIPKETIMAKIASTDFLGSFQNAVNEFQTKAQGAYEKGNSALGEANDFAKGNVEALVESGKILASGLQELGATFVNDSRSAFESMTAEVKELAAAKTPTDFLSLQSALLRKHFDHAVAQASKNTEAMFKLASDAATPLSGRIAVAVEKVGKAA